MKKLLSMIEINKNIIITRTTSSGSSSNITSTNCNRKINVYNKRNSNQLKSNFIWFFILINFIMLSVNCDNDNYSIVGSSNDDGNDNFVKNSTQTIQTRINNNNATNYDHNQNKFYKNNNLQKNIQNIILKNYLNDKKIKDLISIRLNNDKNSLVNKKLMNQIIKNVNDHKYIINDEIIKNHNKNLYINYYENINNDDNHKIHKRSITKNHNKINENSIKSKPKSESMIFVDDDDDASSILSTTSNNILEDGGNINRGLSSSSSSLPSLLTSTSLSSSSTISIPSMSSSFHSKNNVNNVKNMNTLYPEEYKFAVSATNSSNSSIIIDITNSSSGRINGKSDTSTNNNIDIGQQHQQQHQIHIDSKDNKNNENNTNYDQNITICYHEEDIQRMDCYISENETCFGDPEYCSYTYDEYITTIKQYMFPTTSEWILICSHVIVFIMGLVGNALVCIAVYTNYSMRTVTNVFIVNLAVADFFVILVCLPPSVVWDVTETWFMGEIMCKIFGYIQVVSVTVSVLTLTFISIDRWYAICFPLRYRTKISRAIASVAFIWIFAFLSNIPELLALTIKGPKLRFGIKLFTQCVTTWDKNTEKNVMLARFMLLYTLPLILMTLAYFKIVRVLWKSDTIPGHRESRNHYQYTCGYSRGSCMPAANTSTMGQLRARRKAAKMLVAVVVMFAICYFPVHMFMVMRFDAGMQDEVKAVLALLSHWLCYANSAVNPVIYNFMSGKFRREFRNALEKCRCSRIRVEDRTLTHSTPASRLNNISPSMRSNYQLTSVRDITRDNSRQTVQTTFMENCGNGNTIINNNETNNLIMNNENLNQNNTHNNNNTSNNNNHHHQNYHNNDNKSNYYRNVNHKNSMKLNNNTKKS